MPHKHSVHDTDTHFIIDGITRAVKNASGVKTMLVQGDHNSERFTFELPRMIDGHDISLCNDVKVHYTNIDSKTREENHGVYVVDDLQIFPDDDEIVVLSWLISSNATQHAGGLLFGLSFRCLSDDGTIEYAWNTVVHKGVSVSSGINNGEFIVEEFPDVIAQLEARIQALEDGQNGGGTPGQQGEKGADGLNTWAATVPQDPTDVTTISKTQVLGSDSRTIQLDDLVIYTDGKVGRVVEVLDDVVTTLYTGIDLKGEDGTNGTNGTSVSITSVTESDADGGENKFLFSDGTEAVVKNGSKGSTGEKGADGKTPVKGTDYWTAEDIAEITNELSSVSVPKSQGASNVGKILVVGADGNLTLSDMPSGDSGDIIGIVGENNAITLTGDLADGTYVFRYENTDGSYTDIGTLVVGGVVQYSITANLTNCVGANNNASVIEDGGTAILTFTANKGYALPDNVSVAGAAYIWDSANGILSLNNPTDDITITIIATKSGYTNIINPASCSDNSRLSTTSGEIKTLEGYVTSPMLYTEDYTKPITFRTRGVDFSQTSSNIVLYYEDTETYISGNSLSNFAGKMWNGWSYSLDENGNLTLVFDSTVRYKFRICGMGSSENFVMTANEEIKE